MFNKLKQFTDLRSQAKTLQNALAQESVSVEKNGVHITMNGNMEITTVKLPDNIAKADLEKSILNCANETIKKTQKIMAQKMQAMGGMPGLDSLLKSK